MKRFSRIIFLAIIVLSIVFRFYMLGSNPPSLDWDEASTGYNAYSILKTGRDEYGNFMPLSFRSFDDYKPPVYIYLTVPSVAVFGLNEFAVRLPAAVFGVIAVIVLYFLVKELLEDRGNTRNLTRKNTEKSSEVVHGSQKNKKSSWFTVHSLNDQTVEWIALLSAFFLAISPWHLQFSRAAFEGNVGMCFLIISLLCFFKAFKRSWLYIPFVLFLALSMYTYHSFELINPIVLIVLLILFYKQLLKQKVLVIGSLILFAIIISPIFTSFFHSQTEGTAARLSMVTIFDDPTLLAQSAKNEITAHQHHDIIGEVLNNRRVIFIHEMIQGYFNHFDFGFLFLHGDGGVQHHAYNMGMLYLWDFPFIILGIYFLIRNFSRRVLLIFILFLLGPLPASITTGTPQPIRAIDMIPWFQIFAATGVTLLTKGISNVQYPISNSKFKLQYIFIGVISVLLLINISYYLYSYYILTPVKYGYFWQYGNKQAVEYAKAHENQYSKIIMTYAYDQPYIYYLFYNKVDPAWYQEHWDYSGTGQVDRFYRKIGKYEFKNITSQDFQDKNALLIGTPKEIPSTAHVLYEIKYLDGTIAYRIAST